MKKFLSLLLCWLTLTLPLGAAIGRIDEFYGIKFGRTLADAKAVMVSKGVALDEKHSTADVLLFREGGYGGEKARGFTLHFVQGQFARGVVTIEVNGDLGMALATFDRLKKTVVAKYGPATEETNKAMSKNRQVEEMKAEQEPQEIVWKQGGGRLKIRLTPLGKKRADIIVVCQDDEAAAKIPSTGKKQPQQPPPAVRTKDI